MLHEFISKTAPQGPALPLEAGDALVVVLKVPTAGKSTAAAHLLRAAGDPEGHRHAADTFERFFVVSAPKRDASVAAPSDERKGPQRRAVSSPTASRDLRVPISELR